MSTSAVRDRSEPQAKNGGFTAEELEQFRHDGYVIARGLADEEVRSQMLAATREGLERMIEPIEYEADLQYPGAPRSRAAAGGRTPRRLKQAHSRHTVFTHWLGDPRLGDRLRQLLGPEVVVPLAHHNCIMTKYPEYSSDTGWHQDIRYWSFRRSELISAWLALGSEWPENGCLQVVPGSHRLELERNRFDEALFFRSDLPENRELIERRVDVPLKAGDVLFFHCRLFHSATRNHSHVPKFSVVFTFRPGDNPPVPGTRSASLPELLIPPTADPQ